MRACLCLLLVAACGVPQPSNKEVDPPPGADEAAELAVAEWSARLGAELDAGDLPPIRWFEGPCLDYGDSDSGKCEFGGLKWGAFDSEIHLVIRWSIHRSSLGHEVLHWALNETTGEYDGDHSAPTWAVQDAVDLALADAGY